jgi:hypothetical protein
MAAQPPGKGQKMMQFLNYRMKITLTDLRTIIGTFLAYDKHMNLVLVSPIKSAFLHPSQAKAFAPSPTHSPSSTPNLSHPTRTHEPLNSLMAFLYATAAPLPLRSHASPQRIAPRVALVLFCMLWPACEPSLPLAHSLWLALAHAPNDGAGGWCGAG